MRITCRYSNVSFLCQGFGKLKLATHHPIMDVPIRTLISRAPDWVKGELDETERRLLFVALLKATDRVEFRVPAIPTRQTIESNMEFLLETVNWLKDIGDYLHLAKYRVTEHTNRLKNIGTWLEVWHGAKRNWEGKTADWQQREILYRREEAFIRLIRSPFRHFKFYQKQLGRWAVEASNAPEYIKDHWVELFNLRDDEDIMSVAKVDLEEMLEHLQDNLKIGGIVSGRIFEHVYQLIKKREGGVEGLLGVEDTDTARQRAKKMQDLRNNPFLIIDEMDAEEREGDEDEEQDEFEQEVLRQKNRRLFGDEFAGISNERINAATDVENRKRVIKLAPLSKPEEKDYPTKVAWLYDLSAWRIAHREYEKQQAEIVKRQEEENRSRDALNEENTLDLPFRDIDLEAENIVRLTQRRAEGIKDE